MGIESSWEDEDFICEIVLIMSEIVGDSKWLSEKGTTGGIELSGMEDGIWSRMVSILLMKYFKKSSGDGSMFIIVGGEVTELIILNKVLGLLLLSEMMLE